MDTLSSKLERLRPGSLDNLLVVLKVAVVVPAALIMFFQDLSILFSDALISETTNYMLAVPFLLLYMVYRKRKMIRASIPLETTKLFKKIPLDETLGAILFLTSFLLYWYGSYTFTPLEYHMFALPIFTAACILIVFNIQTLKQLLFPVVFLFLLVPPPEEALYYLGSFLSTISTELAYNLLRILSFPVTMTTEYGTPVMRITQQNGQPISLVVDIACSGIYSQIGFLIFALFIAYIVRERTWKKGLIFVLGFPLIYFLNVLRIFTIGVIGCYYGEDLALTAFHLLGGWILIFIGTLLLLGTLEKGFKIPILSGPAQQCATCNTFYRKGRGFCFTCGRIDTSFTGRISKPSMLKAAAVVAAVAMILSIQTSVFALTEGPEMILQTAAGEQFTTTILPEVPEYSLEFVYRDLTFEERAQQDVALVYAYFPANESEEVIYATLEVASARSTLHRWETCLISWPLRQGYQPWVEQIELQDVQLLENPPIIGRYFTFEKKASNLTQTVLYWYETSIFEVNSTTQQKHIKISLVAYPNSLEELPRLKEQMLSVAVAIVSYWEPIKQWSPIALGISLNGDKLVLASLALLGVVLAFYAVDNRVDAKRNRIAYEKLSEMHRKTVETVRTVEQKMLPTLSSIHQSYRNTAAEKTEVETTLQNLTDLEKIGIVKREIGNMMDEPVQTWRTRVS